MKTANPEKILSEQAKEARFLKDLQKVFVLSGKHKKELKKNHLFFFLKNYEARKYKIHSFKKRNSQKNC